MNIQRIYYNASDELIRTDNISIEVLPPSISGVPITINNDSAGLQMRVGPQLVRSQILASGEAGAVGSRVVTKIEVFGEYDDYDDTGPSYNITWVSRTLSNGQVIRCNMSGLGMVGDTV